MRASRNQPARFSIDVSKEDKPLSSQPEGSSNSRSPQPAPPDEEVKKLDPRRHEERFAMLNTGIYECRSCGYRYDEATGNPSSYPIPPGLQFGSFPTTGGGRPAGPPSPSRVWRSRGSRRTSSSGWEATPSPRGRRPPRYTAASC